MLNDIMYFKWFHLELNKLLTLFIVMSWIYYKVDIRQYLQCSIRNYLAFKQGFLHSPLAFHQQQMMQKFAQLKYRPPAYLIPR